MTDPTRWLDRDDGSFDVALLRAGRRDAPRAAAVASAVVALTASGAAVGAAVSANGAVNAASQLAKASLAGIAKWFGIGLASGLVVTGGVRFAVEVAKGHPEVATVVTSNPPAPVVAAREHHLFADVPRAPVPEPPSTLAPVIALPPDDVAVPRSSGTSAGYPERRAVTREVPIVEVAPSAPLDAPEAPHASLPAELALLESARGALVAHRPRDVLGIVDGYDRMTRTGVLDSEAEMLRIEALLQLGNVSAARALAAQAIAANPGGAHVARLREIVGG